MPPPPSRGQEIILPPSALRALADAAAAAKPGAEGVLVDAGREVGTTLHPALMEDEGAGPPRDFWDRLQRLFSRRGLGTLTHRRIHPGIGLLESPGVAELLGAPDHGGEAPFTTGILLGILSATAGRPVDLRQIRPPPSGAASACRWVFGSPAALDGLEKGLGHGRTLEEALADL